MKVPSTFKLQSCILAWLSSCIPDSRTTDSTTSTSEAASTSLGVSTTSGAQPTTEDKTTHPTTGIDEDSSTASGTGTTLTPSGTTGGTATTGMMTEGCTHDSECELLDDCCSCLGVPAGAEQPSCDVQQCQESKCSELGINNAVCRLGVCETERLSCNGPRVLCDMPPPSCALGLLPETSPDCWTGRCIPSEYCDHVPQCDSCLEGQMCVEIVGEGADDWPICEPVPPDCQGTVSCECVESKVCLGFFTSCTALSNVVRCQCPDC